MKSTVLITGGLGYIGSHTVVEMMQAGYNVVIIDSLANSRLEVLNRIETIVGEKPHFVHMDLCDKSGLTDFFNSDIGKNVRAVIHFAAYKNVGESVANPLKYYHNNLNSLINTVGCMVEHDVQYMVYSSSCSVYGNPETVQVTEETPLQPAASPYGNTKEIGEEIIEDTVRGGKIQAVSLRYFNPIGAHPSNAIGEFPTEFMDNLIPALTGTARGTKSCFFVYGDDYNTPDGTCIRDYIDITDLAKAHVKALDLLFSGEHKQTHQVFNLGTGKGVSVMEMIEMIQRVSGLKLAYEVKPRREGDVEAVYANSDLANKKLGWRAARSLEDMISTSWAWSGEIEEIQKNE